ncbi:hypothetical protein H0H93_015029 [Arthromyces matolae]|nr:hypothetical protein H0H93_015029 [Arthromyces matolae]
MNETEVLIVDPDGLSLYKMPPLFDHQNGVTTAFDEHEIPEATPMMFFAHPSSRQGCEIEIPSLGWMPLRKGRQYFYIVSHCDSDLFSHDIYAIIKTNHDEMPEKIPVIRHSYHPDPTPAYNSQIRFCEDFATIAWSREELGISIFTAKITDLPLGKGGDLVPQGTTSWLWKGPESYPLDSYRFSLCPASGRLCIITEIGEVRVLDYLAPYN